MTRPTRPSSKTESAVGIVILMTLAGIATGLYFQQFRFDAADAAPLPRPPSPSATVQTATDLTLASYAPEGFAPMSAVETFDRDNLFDKIDGKAELYLTAGVTGMKCQRSWTRQCGGVDGGVRLRHGRAAQRVHGLQQAEAGRRGGTRQTGLRDAEFSAL